MATQGHRGEPQSEAIDEARRKGKGHASTVVVTATKVAQKQWNFSMTQDGVPVEALEFSKEGKKKADWHDVLFQLDDPSGKLAFHPDKEDALWVNRGSADAPPACPASRSADPWDEFRVKSAPKPTELLVHNGNSKKCFLNYRLNFVAAGGGSKEIIASHDPVVGNKNGGDL